MTAARNLATDLDDAEEGDPSSHNLSTELDGAEEENPSSCFSKFHQDLCQHVWRTVCEVPPAQIVYRWLQNIVDVSKPWEPIPGDCGKDRKKGDKRLVRIWVPGEEDSVPDSIWLNMISLPYNEREPGKYERFPRSKLKTLLNDGGFMIMDYLLKHAGPSTCLVVPHEFLALYFEKSEMIKCAKVPSVEIDGSPLYLGMDNHGTVFPLTQSWFDDNEEDRSIRASIDGWCFNFCWNKVRPGHRYGLRQRKCLANHNDLPIKPLFCDDIRVRYRQFPGEMKCLIASFASALFEYGLVQESRAIYGKVCERPQSDHSNDFIHRVVNNELHGRYQFRRCRKKKRFDPLARTCRYPTVVLLKQKGADAYPHAVSFYKDHIFDASFPFALKRSRDNLDYICRGRGNYLGVWWAKQIVPHTGNQ